MSCNISSAVVCSGSRTAISWAVSTPQWYNRTPDEQGEGIQPCELLPGHGPEAGGSQAGQLGRQGDVNTAVNLFADGKGSGIGHHKGAHQSGLALAGAQMQGRATAEAGHSGEGFERQEKAQLLRCALQTSRDSAGRRLSRRTGGQRAAERPGAGEQLLGAEGQQTVGQRGGLKHEARLLSNLA